MPPTDREECNEQLIKCHNLSREIDFITILLIDLDELYSFKYPLTNSQIIQESIVVYQAQCTDKTYSNLVKRT